MKYRMYHLVMYNISPIQQGIQSYHAGMEYARKYWDDEEFQQWLKNDKTVILLNGGTSQYIYNDPERLGTMQKYYKELIDGNIKCAYFNEPDLNYSMSAIAFLVPEQVWDKEKYPDFNENFGIENYDNPHSVVVDDDEYNDWINSVGGEKNVWLRQFLSQFKLA